MLNCPKPCPSDFIAPCYGGRSNSPLVRRIPRILATLGRSDVLVMDRAPADAPCHIRAFYNPVNQEYGRSRGPGYRSAIRDDCREERRPR
jgi:hypothetical protein